MKQLLFTLALLTVPLFGADDLAKNVKRINNKVYVDNIQQVSQKRSYCVPAATSMVLRYYDEKIPQNKLARLFETSKSTGTSSAEIIAAFDSGAIEGFSIRRLYGLSKQEFDSLFNAYGMAVSKSKMRKVAKMGNQAFEVVDPQVAVPLFAKQRKNLHDLMIVLLKKNIDAGIPMLWTVEMNLDPEDRVSGAHMRLLVGYSVDKSGEIDRVLYRDSWGKRTDIKSMTLDNAVAMTYEIFVVLPNEMIP